MSLVGDMIYLGKHNFEENEMGQEIDRLYSSYWAKQCTFFQNLSISREINFIEVLKNVYCLDIL